MAENLTQYKCAACGGSMKFDAASGKLKCEYCGELYTIEEAKALYEKENAKVVEEAKTASKEESWGAQEGMKGYKCSSCGAEIICEDTTGATSCPYCGNKSVMPQQFTGMMRPKYVIPFKVEKDEMKAKLNDYYKGKKLLPSSFTNTNHIDEVKGVYVPFWLYSGIVETDLSYNAEIEDVKKTATEKITTTKHYKVHRKGTVSFTNIPTDASESMPDDLMDSVEPYNYGELKDFEMEYLLGFLADKYDVSKEEGLKRARKRAEASAIDVTNETLEKDYTSYTEIKNNRSIKYMSEKEEYALLPVWLLSTNWNGENFLFAANGQTGEMVGNLPIDRTKQILRVLLIMIPVLLVIMFFGDFTSGSMIFAAVASIIAGFVANSIMVSSMKPVKEKSRANDYLDVNGKEKIKLSIKEDTYVNTTVEKEPIKQN